MTYWDEKVFPLEENHCACAKIILCMLQIQHGVRLTAKPLQKFYIPDQNNHSRLGEPDYFLIVLCNFQTV